MHAGKNEVLIFDYVDGNVPVLAKMFAKRLRGYRALGYEDGLDLPVGPLARDLTVEYETGSS